MSKYHQSIYVPRNPEKYIGNVNNIVMRSGWERRFAIWCDTNPSVLRWSSEETIVPYVCPTDYRTHRYFIDFFIMVKDAQGNMRKYLVEIKPFEQTQPPKNKRNKQRLVEEAMTFAKNTAKWKAAKKYASDRGWDFIIITEYELGLKKRK